MESRGMKVAVLPRTSTKTDLGALAGSCAAVSRDFVCEAKGGTGVLLDLRVSPKAKETAVTGAYGEATVKMKVAAPPVERRANAEIERFLAGLLRLPLSQVSVIRGISGRDKVVLFRDIESREVREGLMVLFGRS
ncbi:MAG: DUF167 domain-containing protein [Rubrobacteraceae bacterium]